MRNALIHQEPQVIQLPTQTWLIQKAMHDTISVQQQLTEAMETVRAIHISTEKLIPIVQKHFGEYGGRIIEEIIVEIER